jgi:hypothetical protein
MGFAVTRNTFLNNPLSGAASTETTSYDGTEISTGYSILYGISGDFELQFYADSKENLEEIVNSYSDGAGNDFEFSDDLNQDVSSIPNDVLIIKQRNEILDGTSIEVIELYQSLFNFQSNSREDLLDYNFNLTEDQINEIFESSLDLLTVDNTSEIQFEYDFKFIEEGTSSDSDVISIVKTEPIESTSVGPDTGGFLDGI